MDEIKKIDPKNQSRDIKEAERSLFLMKNATVPAVIVECGFLSNPQEAHQLCTPDYQKQLVLAIAAGYLLHQ